MISFSTSALGEPRSESRPLLHHHRADLDAALVSRLLLSSRITVVGTRGQAMVRQVAAISIGVFERETRLDLAYVEDQKADTDLNLVMGSDQGIIEVQGTAEGPPFSRAAEPSPHITPKIPLKTRCSRIISPNRIASRSKSGSLIIGIAA